MKDKLFMLNPGFLGENNTLLYCGDSVSVEGLISFFPELREKIDISYIPAPRPRKEILALIGEENQSAPVLILADDTVVKDASIPLARKDARRFIATPDDIRRYLSSQYEVAHSS